MQVRTLTPLQAGPRERVEIEPAPRRLAPIPHERSRHEPPGERTHPHPR